MNLMHQYIYELDLISKTLETYANGHRWKRSKKSINIKRDLITKYLKDQNLRKINKGGKKERR